MLLVLSKSVILLGYESSSNGCEKAQIALPRWDGKDLVETYLELEPVDGPSLGCGRLISLVHLQDQVPRQG